MKTGLLIKCLAATCPPNGTLQLDIHMLPLCGQTQEKAT